MYWHAMMLLTFFICPFRLYVEETNRKNLPVEEFKKVTNYAKTKEILKTTTFELPYTPELQDIKKLF